MFSSLFAFLILAMSEASSPAGSVPSAQVEGPSEAKSPTSPSPSMRAGSGVFAPSPSSSVTGLFSKMLISE